MRNIIISLIMVAVLSMAGCDMMNLDESVTGGGVMEVTLSSSTEVDSRSMSVSSSSVSDPDKTVESETNYVIDRTFFRSSSVEFWSTQLAGGYTNLASSNGFTSVNFTESYDNLSFVPGSMNVVNSSENAAFNATMYDIARIDMGSGAVTWVYTKGEDEFYIGKSEYVDEYVDYESSGNIYYSDVYNHVINPDGPGQQSETALDGNSVFLVHRDILSNHVYVPSDDYFGSSYDELLESYGTFIADFVYSNRGEIDGSGGLFVPFDGVDLRNVDGSNITINFDWDPAGSIIVDDNRKPTMANRINGTPFDFDISVDIQ